MQINEPPSQFGCIAFPILADALDKGLAETLSVRKPKALQFIANQLKLRAGYLAVALNYLEYIGWVKHNKDDRFILTRQADMDFAIAISAIYNTAISFGPKSTKSRQAFERLADFSDTALSDAHRQARGDLYKAAVWSLTAYRQYRKKDSHIGKLTALLQEKFCFLPQAYWSLASIDKADGVDAFQQQLLIAWVNQLAVAYEQSWLVSRCRKTIAKPTQHLIDDLANYKVVDVETLHLVCATYGFHLQLSNQRKTPSFEQTAICIRPLNYQDVEQFAEPIANQYLGIGQPQLKATLKHFAKGQLLIEIEQRPVALIMAHKLATDKLTDASHLSIDCFSKAVRFEVLNLSNDDEIATQEKPFLDFVLQRFLMASDITAVYEMLRGISKDAFSHRLSLRKTLVKGVDITDIPVVDAGTNQDTSFSQNTIFNQDTILIDYKFDGREMKNIDDPKVDVSAEEIHDVAIVGMSCRFPGAKNYHEYWDNLVNGVNSVSEIPKDRWNWQDYYGDPIKEDNKTQVKWGGFIEDIDKFDPLFFNISPAEANYIDPQHRIFLEAVWHAIEDAGYSLSSLETKKVGVYAGVSKNDYAELMRENHESIISFVSTGTVHSILANRVSFLLDFNGKSEVVDTACSSFLVALNNAIRDIRLGVCESAVVGGVNAILTPTMYISHAKSGMLSEDGACRTFDKGANGYVRSEGVGVVFVKPLKAAIADNDNILGVVKGVCVQHGGRSNFLTAPKVSAQASVVTDAISDAAIDPMTIGYIEAHGTGTPLGDPIEINALKEAYKPFIKGEASEQCILSSVKTNVGHLESAAGIAGLIKILLSMKHKLIPRLIHFEELNPYIKLDGSHFEVADKNTPWTSKSAEKGDYPLRAALSSFGMGGVNAHAIFEAPPERATINANTSDAYLIPLSAKSEGQLKEYAQSLASFIKGAEDIAINDIAFTLQQGRNAMVNRCALIVSNLDELTNLLDSFAQGRQAAAIYTGVVKETGDEPTTVSPESLTDAADAWVDGAAIDWLKLTGENSGVRISLPTYPFKKLRCWFSKNTAAAAKPASAQQVQLSTNQYFLRDHRVKDECVVPGVRHLEFLRAAVEDHSHALVRRMHDVYWMKPIKVAKELACDANIVAASEKGSFKASIDDANGQFSSAVLSTQSVNAPTQRLDLEKIKRRCQSVVIESESLYGQFKASGLNYGETFQVIKQCSVGSGEIICELQQSDAIDARDVLLEPSMMDGVFQSVVALHLATTDEPEKQLLPFYLKQIEVYGEIPSRCFAYARFAESANAGEHAYNMFLCDEAGNILVKFDEFLKRVYELDAQAATEAPAEMLYYKPEWVERRLGMRRENLATLLAFDDQSPLAIESLIGSTANMDKKPNLITVESGAAFNQLDNHRFQVCPTEGESFSQLWQSLKQNDTAIENIIFSLNFDNCDSVQSCIDHGVKSLLLLTQSLIAQRQTSAVNILYVYDVNDSLYASVHEMVGGFARTLAYENPLVSVNSVGVDCDNQQQLQRNLVQELEHYSNAPLHEVRYIGDKRYVRAVTAVSGFKDQPATPSVKQGGTYLISGGAGGLGFTFAAHLAEHYQAKLILLGRKPLNEAISTKLEKLVELGGIAEYRQADVSQKADIDALAETFSTEQLVLDGVLHCAGLIEDAYIIKKTTDSFDRVVAPKVHGILNLDALTATQPLDFFVMFSSIAAIMPNQGQCDYAAANSFLDAFAKHRNGLLDSDARSGVSLAFNWPLWKDGGIGVIAEEEEHLWQVFGMKPLEDEPGLQVFDRALSNYAEIGEPQLIAIEGNRQKIEKHLVVYPSIESAEPLDLTLEERVSICLYQGIEVATADNDSIDRKIGLTENLSDYGVDSLGFPRLIAYINQHLALQLDPTVFFEYNTVEKLKPYLVSLCESSDASVVNAPQAIYTPERGLVDLDLSNPDGFYFEKSLSHEEFFMRDHVVEGKYNMPGACYIEMAFQAGEALSDNSAVLKLTNNYWVKQLSTSGDPIKVELSMKEKEGYYEYEIGHFDGQEYAQHSVGQLYIGDAEAITLEQTKIDIEAVKQRCQIERLPKEVYEFIHAEGLHVGPSFMPMERIVLNPEEALSHLKLPEDISATYSDYILHPSLLTGVLQTALLNNKPDGMDNTRFIPLGIDEIVVKEKMPAECYIYTRVADYNQSSNQISKFDARVLTLEGDVVIEVKGLTLRNLTADAAAKSNTATAVVANSDVDLLEVENLLKGYLSDAIGMSPSDIEADTSLESYGINSVMIVDLNRRLGEVFGNLSKTLFFEYQTIRELAQYFAEHHKAVVMEKIGGDASAAEAVETGAEESSESVIDMAPVASHVKNQALTQAPLDDIFVSIDQPHSVSSASLYDEDIAIIGVNGRYPQADNLEAFWENLKAGKDCVTKSPADRFDYEKLHATFGEESILNGQWGGYINDVDKFDPQFFSISPREAEQIDPQERLFLEVVWGTLESAGYNPANLKGEAVGVFVGALWQPYINLGIEQTAQGNLQRPSGLLYSIPNRASFFFDWSGPSIAIDTACSASLTALHLAVESLRSGDSSSAIVGGVNLSLSPSKYLWLSHNNFLASDGRCKTFGASGDGYVPGEGVGAVYLKRLSDALRDGDRIEAVIKSTSVNHGGRTNGYTVPNPNRQADLIAKAIDKSGVSPEDISYVEAHGTGTSLGDPIEITGLKKAFGKHTDKTQYCAIGSVKSNIGHLEAAAGVAGLTKIILQMRHKTLVPSIHCEPPNPNIDFDSTPFVVQKELTPWADSTVGNIADSNQPHTAMISSFGAGGSNAHAIIQEYQATTHAVLDVASTPCLIPLSAKTEQALGEMVDRLANYLHGERALTLADIAYTLQVGRQPMEERLAILAGSVDELRSKLVEVGENYRQKGHFNGAGIFKGNIKSAKQLLQLFSSDENFAQIINQWVQNGSFEKVANLWINGIDIDWQALYTTEPHQRVDLPKYPFRKQRFWIKEIAEMPAPAPQIVEVASKQALHPWLDENISDLYQQAFVKRREGNLNPSLTVNGRKALDAGSLLQMLDAAVRHALNACEPDYNQTLRLGGIQLDRQALLSSFERCIVTVNPSERNDQSLDVEVSSADASNNALMALIQANCQLAAEVNSDVIAIDALGASLTPVDMALLQGHLADQAFGYHTSSIKSVKASATQCLVELGSAMNESQPVSFDPQLLNGCLQAGAYWMGSEANSVADFVPLLPTAIDELVISQPLSAKVFALINKAQSQQLSISLYDEMGRLCLRIQGIHYDQAAIASPAVESQPVSEPTVQSTVQPIAQPAAQPIAPVSTPVQPVATITIAKPAAQHVMKEKHFATTAAEKPSAIALSAPSVKTLVNGSDNQSAIVLSAPAVKPEAASTVAVAPLKQTPVVKTAEVVAAPMATPHSGEQPAADEVLNWLKASLASALYMDANEVDEDKQFTDLGLDSIVGVEWVRSINKHYSLAINATQVYDYPTLQEFAQFVVSQLASAAPVTAPEASVTRETTVVVEATPAQEVVIDTAKPQVASADVLSSLKESLAAALYMSADEVDEDKQFTDLGLDSIVGVEWVRSINKQYTLSINATQVYDYPTLQEFAQFVVNQLTPTSSGATPLDVNDVINRDVEPKAPVNGNAALPEGQIQQALIEKLASALYLQEDEVDPEKSFTEMGLDSIIGVEWVKSINKDFGTNIAATTVYDYPTIHDFARFLHGMLPAKAAVNGKASYAVA